jgi:putative two-component system response regulator
VTVGRAVGLNDDDLGALAKGGYLHDLGKVGIPDAILNKPSRLTPDEWAIMRQHPIIGDKLCGELRSLRRVRPIVRHHHERLDGSGYPDGLRGDAIPILAQVLSVIDVFDALTTLRPYKTALPPEEAYALLTAEVERGWRNPAIVDALITLGRRGHLLPAAAAEDGAGGPQVRG